MFERLKENSGIEYRNARALFNGIFCTSRYKNRPHMTFDDVAMEPEQEFELCVDTQGVHEYSPK